MKFEGLLFAVRDMEKAKNFYENVMEQKVAMDLGVHVSFEQGFSLQSNYPELVGVDLEMKARPNNFQLYFEVDDLKYWEEKLENTEGIEFLHKAKEYPWGQNDIRFYDYDGYIIEVAERMETVIKRYLAQGLSIEETAERTMYPVEFVKTLV